MADTLKLCRGCRWFSAGDGKCRHESATIRDYVRGEHRQYAAQVHRVWTGKGDCGPGAQFFEIGSEVVL
jgi:hypothetical protein